MEKILYFVDVMKTREIKSYMISVLILILFFLLSSICAKIIMKCFKIKPEKLERKSKIYKLIKFTLNVLGVYISIIVLDFPESWIYKVTKIFKLIMICLFTKIIAQFIRPSSKLFEKFSGENDSKNKSTIKFAIKFVRGIIYSIGAFIFISELGYDLSGIITGLGIGSVVIALAAQDLAKNLFGGVAILTDKTFVIGDVIDVGGTSGTVEDITFRTTRIRKYDDSIVTMPNSMLADSEIINWSRLNKRRYECTLKVGFDTSKKDINDIINKIGFELQKNEDIIKDSFRIYFSKIEKDGYEIFMYMYTSAVNYDTYLEFIDGVNDSIVELMEKENVKLVYPTYKIIQK